MCIRVSKITVIDIAGSYNDVQNFIKFLITFVIHVLKTYFVLNYV